jgi:hypothetical protein
MKIEDLAKRMENNEDVFILLIYAKDPYKQFVRIGKLKSMFKDETTDKIMFKVKSEGNYFDFSPESIYSNYYEAYHDAFIMRMDEIEFELPKKDFEEYTDEELEDLLTFNDNTKFPELQNVIKHLDYYKRKCHILEMKLTGEIFIRNDDSPFSILQTRINEFLVEWNKENLKGKEE